MEPSFVSANKTHRPRASGAKADKKEAYQKKKKGIDGEKHKNAKVSRKRIIILGFLIFYFSRLSQGTSRTALFLLILLRKRAYLILSTMESYP